MRLQKEIPGPERAALLKEAQGVLKEYNVEFDIDELVGPSREGDLPSIRALVSLYFRKQGYSFAHIGGIINRDHSTVIHLCKPSTKSKYRQVRTVLGSRAEAKKIESEIARLQKRLEAIKEKL